ncbi:hypothetical protein F4782DRAFT_482036 [Xylaria castorea]|nr:hypothetical protein F4782DRAFT_482036 [Xylaria castorea]
MVEQVVRSILEKLKDPVSYFRFDIRTTFNRHAFSGPTDDAFVLTTVDPVCGSLGTKPVLRGGVFWVDFALLSAEGISILIWGPRGEGLHAKGEFVYVDSVTCVTDTLSTIATRYCS